MGDGASCARCARAGETLGGAPGSLRPKALTLPGPARVKARATPHPQLWAQRSALSSPPPRQPHHFLNFVLPPLHLPTLPPMYLPGFPSQVQALQFEWAWQNPHRSRYLKQAIAQLKAKRALNGAKGKVLLLHHMLQARPWSVYPLALQVLSSKFEPLLRGCPPLPAHVPSTVGPLDTLDMSGAVDEDEDEGEGEGEVDIETGEDEDGKGWEGEEEDGRGYGTGGSGDEYSGAGGGELPEEPLEEGGSHVPPRASRGGGVLPVHVPREVSLVGDGAPHARWQGAASSSSW